MTVFKAFFTIMKKNIGTVILYTVMLVLFGCIQYSNSDNNISFNATKANVVIVDNDNSQLSNNLVNYFKDNSNLKDNMNEDEINDAVFYRQVNYVIYIYDGFENDILNSNYKKLEIKSSGDYNASLAEIMLNRYLHVQKSYSGYSKEDIIKNTNKVLSKSTNVEVNSKLPVSTLNKINNYYNFASYTLMAVIILVLNLILSSFNDDKIKKRIIVSSKSYVSYNKEILKASIVYSTFAFIFYNILAFILLGSEMFTIRGLLYVINSFIYILFCLILSLVISNLLKDKGAINGVVNVLAVGSSFLCGVFVPMMWLGDGLIKFAHILPTFYYVSNNNILSNLEVININSLNEVFINSIILLGFVIILFIINLIISRYKRKVG